MKPYLFVNINPSAECSAPAIAWRVSSCSKGGHLPLASNWWPIVHEADPLEAG